MKLNYVIKYAADMNEAVAFYRDKLGLELKVQYPGWAEFVTGETTLALHPASDAHPAGSLSLGFGVEDFDEFYAGARKDGIEFTAEDDSRDKRGTGSRIPSGGPAGNVA